MTIGENSAAPGRLPDFLIAGVAKCGTTSLAHYLTQHPQIFMSAEKELHFFDRHWEKGLDWYRDQFAAAGDAIAVGEATPTYVVFDGAFAGMSGVLDGARLVLIVRHPVDRAYSHYWFNRWRDKRKFARAVDDELSGRGPSWGYVEHGRYIELVDRVLTRYPADRLHVVVLDDLRREPVATVQALYGFLGVDATVVPAGVEQVHNPAFRFRSNLVLGALMATGMWRLAPRLARAIDRANRVQLNYEPMDATVRAELLDHFSGPNRRLAEWLRRDLSEWSS